MTTMDWFKLILVLGLSYNVVAVQDFKLHIRSNINLVPYPSGNTTFKSAHTWPYLGYYALDYLQIAKNSPTVITQYMTQVCQKLRPGERFRLQDLTEEKCGTVGICVTSRGAYFSQTSFCKPGRFFDVDRQACLPKDRVHNCNKPFGDRDKIAKVYGDEKDRSVDLTQQCFKRNCKFPKCYCSRDGTKIPGNIPRENTPQMILISLQGSVGHQEGNSFRRIFSPRYKNPNGCTIKGTYFVSNKYSNYVSVEQFKAYGHEIGTFSITKTDNSLYWITPNEDTYKDEFVGSREMLKNFANIQDDEVVGIRVPFLYPGGESQFQMMVKNGFLYDSTMAVQIKRNNPNFVWPYNLRFGMPHSCHSLYDENCPRFNVPYNVWEIPLNEIDRSVNSEELTGCAILSNCHFEDPEHFKKVLQRDFNRHYEGNRAPINWSFDAGFFRDPQYLSAFLDVIEWVQREFPNDAYFVSNKMALDWIRNPTPNYAMHNFELWKGKSCRPGRRVPIRCLDGNSCELPTFFNGQDEVIYMFTCSTCPAHYPWIRNTAGTLENNY